jgi:HAD superfamily hydrolase (TIGR01490 family)
MTPAAFFDLDGTLLPPPSLEQRFVRFLLRRGELGLAQGIRWLACFLQKMPRDFRAATAGNKAYLAGVPSITVEEWANNIDREPLLFFEKGLRRLEWHAAQAHRIFLVSGTFAPLARIAAAFLPPPVESHATELEQALHCWTGQLAGEWLSGEAKARVVLRLAAKYDLDLPRSFAYGDCLADVPMLRAVGHPVAANPSAQLERLARRCDWPALEWRATKTTRPASVRELFFSLMLGMALRSR